METCGGCGTRFARGFMRCPRCRVPAPSYADLIPAAVGGARVETAAAVVDLGSVTLAALREAAKQRGLPVYGSKAQVLERLRSAAVGGAP